MTSFVTAYFHYNLNSSSAALPIALTCLEKSHGVDRRVAQFVLPVGITISKNGMGIYNSVSAIYIAQCQYGGSLDFGSSVLVW